MRKKVLYTVGDSHSSTLWGDAWPQFLSRELNYDLITNPSPGAGTSMYLEKINTTLQNSHIDLAIVQLSEPSRIVLGLNEYKPDGSPCDTLKADYDEISDLLCYTFNVNNNDDNLSHITDNKVDIDKFWIPYVATSKWVDYKFFQDIVTIQALFDHYGIKVVFWSWFVNLNHHVPDTYKWLLDKITYIDVHALEWVTNGMDPETVFDGFHYAPSTHKEIVTKFLLPSLKKKLVL